MSPEVIKACVVPGQPQPLMVPEQNEGWMKLRRAYEEMAKEIKEANPDVLIIYSTKWLSVIGHQIQARKNPVWTHVDDEWHEYGEIEYSFNIDSELAHQVNDACHDRGLHTRTVDYHGFPIDTGSIVALKLLNPDNKIPAIILSSNMYADRTETVVLAKSIIDALKKSGKKAVAIASTALSNRYHDQMIDPKEDRIHSLKDHEWNLKMLEFFEQGRLEDVSQLSRQIQQEARVHKVTNFKPFWWLSTMMGQTNYLEGKIFEYQPLYGMGGALVSLTPSDRSFGDLEYDEADPENFQGDRNVLKSEGTDNESEDTGGKE